MATLRQVAAALGVSERRVLQLVHLGMPRSGRGDYDLPGCCSWYLRFIVESPPAVARRDQRQSALDLAAEQARLAAEQADKIALQNEQRRGELMDAASAAQAWAVIVAHLRRQLQPLPGRLAAELAQLTDQAAIKARLTDAIYDVLQASTQPPNLGEPHARASRSKRRH